MSGEILSVRARHKRDTISSIHDMAAQSALVNGLTHTKVEDISAAVGISKRTFFNYFPTKEDAVLGLQEPSLPSGAIEAFSDSKDDTLTRTTALILAVMRTTTVPGSSMARRKELRQRFPELYARFEVRALAAEAIIRPVIAEYASPDGLDTTDQEIDIILRLAGTIIRYAYGIDPEIKDESIAQSIATFKTTIRKIL